VRSVCSAAMTIIDLAERTDPGPGGRGSGKRLLYEEVIALVDRLVVDGNLAPGDLLPTQAELARAAGVSLITVRRALDELERAGRVRRHQGVGTFLARPRIVSEPGRAGGLLGTLEQQQPPPRIGTKVLALERGRPSADLARVLGLRRGAQVWRLHRQRLIAGQPRILETAHIPVALAPDLDAYAESLTGSLYSLLRERYGIEDAAEEQYLAVVAPTAEEARLLQLTKRSLVARLRGLSLDNSGVAFDSFEQVYPASDFIFCISEGGTRRLVEQPELSQWDVDVSAPKARRR
jgi:DNA-binding GntR family transcriptional regulator